MMEAADPILNEVRQGAFVPEDYATVSLDPAAAGPVRLFVLVRKQPDALGGRLVVLRSMMDATVYLGCLADESRRVHRWVEVWVQDLAGFHDVARSLSVAREALSNEGLDERWRMAFRSLNEADMSSIVQLGWETENPPPILLDPDALRSLHPVDAQTGQPWRLCRDDTLLQRCALPTYSGTLHRYLYQPSLADQSGFVPLTEGAPLNEHTLERRTVFEDGSKLIPLNPTGSLMLARYFSPLSLEDLVGLLGGGGWAGVAHGRARLKIGRLPIDDPIDIKPRTAPA